MLKILFLGIKKQPALYFKVYSIKQAVINYVFTTSSLVLDRKDKEFPKYIPG